MSILRAPVSRDSIRSVIVLRGLRSRRSDLNAIVIAFSDTKRIPTRVWLTAQWMLQ